MNITETEFVIAVGRNRVPFYIPVEEANPLDIPLIPWGEVRVTWPPPEEHKSLSVTYPTWHEAVFAAEELAEVLRSAATAKHKTLVAEWFVRQ